VADTTGQPAAKKAPHSGVGTDNLDAAKDEKAYRRPGVVSSPADPKDVKAPFLSEGTRLEIEETGTARDPFTGRDLTKKDLP